MSRPRRTPPADAREVPGNVELCGSCRARIRWLVTAANRKWIPVNADPDPAGNLVRLPDGAMAAIGDATKRAAHADAGRQFWMPHAATCTAATPRVPTPRLATTPPARVVDELAARRARRTRRWSAT